MHQHRSASLPPAARCYRLGQAVGRAVEVYERDLRVLVIGSGGLSHQLDGRHAGFINMDFDLQFMGSLITNPQWATQYSIAERAELTGTQGVELLIWLTARGALSGAVETVHSTTTPPFPTPQRDYWRTGNKGH